MRSHQTLTKLFFAAALAVAITFAPAGLTTRSARAASDAGSGSGAGLASGMIGLVPGQTARLSVWNAGDKDVGLRLLFIDGDGKVLIQCNDVVPSGKSHSHDFPYPGGDGRVEFHGEVRADSKQDLQGLAPSLQIIDDKSGQTVAEYGANDFVRFGPIFHPPGE